MSRPEGPGWRRVSLHKPPYNALTPEFCLQLAGQLEAAAEDPSIGAILLDSAGKNFCVGADLKWAASQGAGSLSRLVRAMHQVCELLLTVPKPVVCVVNGAAAGGGMSIALCADFRLAGERASFRLAYPQVGVSLDGGSSFRLPQLIGMNQTQSLLCEDRILGATEALQLGLVNQLLTSELLPARTSQLLEQLAGGPTRAFGESKHLLNPPEWVRQRLQMEAEAIDRTAATPESLNAIERFLGRKADPLEKGLS
ncbi:enoyl-CoA hydratase/isomerase family protein [bacterium]|nr:enoyl-CoA hydratase/isomerase family protein [bacterium]